MRNVIRANIPYSLELEQLPYRAVNFAFRRIIIRRAVGSRFLVSQR